MVLNELMDLAKRWAKRKNSRFQAKFGGNVKGRGQFFKPAKGSQSKGLRKKIRSRAVRKMWSYGKK